MNYKEAYEKAKALVAQMTVEEAASQLLYNAPAIERLGITDYNWWNEALHGVARAGTATVFPQAIGLAAAFDDTLIGEIADAISIEGRAKYNQNVKFNDHDIYKGLTFWSPNVNIFRDPHWGRGQETYGEDPFLTATLGCSFIDNLQGDGEFLKGAACAKHFAVHSGPEGKRHEFNAVATRQDMFETYLPAFEWAVKKSGVRGIMGAYNRTNGEPCCANSVLMQEILFGKWGFEGYFVSDCWAINDFFSNHHYTNSHKESAALALKTGCDLNCGDAFRELMDAYEEDMVTEEDIKNAATRLYTIRYMLGEFEEERPYSDIPFSKVCCKEHQELNLRSARESLVLLKNEGGFLPLSPEKVGSIAAVGSNVLSTRALEGNYNGRAERYITVADGIISVFENSKVYIAEGCKMCEQSDGEPNLYSTGLAAATSAEVTVLCLGFDYTLEGEEGCTSSDECFDRGDKVSLLLPETQRRLAEMVCDNCENVIVIIMTGSAVDLGEKVTKHAKAIIQAWYPGSLGGLAIAELIAGKFSPSAKLPVTFYRETDNMPDYEDYSMNGRTYRFLDFKPLYPFGYGLSYTTFEFNGEMAEADDDYINVSVKVTNTGSAGGKTPVQVYAKYTDSRYRTPNFQLCGIKKVYLEPGESKDVDIKIDKYWIKAVNDDGERVNPDGEITLYIGDHQPDELSCELCSGRCVSVKIQ